MLDFLDFGGFVPLAVSSALDSDSADAGVFGFFGLDLLFGVSDAETSLTLDSGSVGGFELRRTFDLILLAKLLEPAIAPGPGSG